MKSYSNIILMGVAVSLLACGKKQPTENTEAVPREQINMVSLTHAQVATAGIELGKVVQRQISGTIKVNGMLDVPPQQMVSVSVPMGGFLKSTRLLQGSHVDMGQAIATVENLDFIQIQQDFLEASNQLELAQMEYTRQQELAKENVNATKTLQQAKSQFTNWSIKSKALSEKLKLLNIKSETLEAGNFSSIITLYSPISGYVTDMNANVGRFANPGDVLFTIVDTEHLHAELTVFEKDFAKIKVGQKIRFSLNNETQERTATIYLMGREIASDRTVRIHGHLDKEDKNLLPGMYLNAVIETGGAMVNTLPSDAIIDFADKKYIFVFDGTTDAVVNYRIVEIQTGNSEMNFTEIVVAEAGLSNWQIVTQGAYALLSKMKNKEEEE
jgi:cobalt-zinc-cadmium efflux system membrane fusion protein